MPTTAFSPASVNTASENEGVHIVRQEDGTVLYVGRSGSTRARLRQHLTGPRDSSILHKRVGELLDDALRRPATGADVRDFLSRCTVEWIETDDSRAVKDRLVQQLRPAFSSATVTDRAETAHHDRGVPEELHELRLQLQPYIGIRFRHLAQRALNIENRSLGRQVVEDLLVHEPKLDRGHWLTVAIDPEGGAPREQAAITSDFDFDALQTEEFSQSPLARHLEALLLVPILKPARDDPGEWYLVDPVTFVPDAKTRRQFELDHAALRDLVAEGPPDDEWRELGRAGQHLRAKTNYTRANPTRAYTDRHGRQHEPKRRGWYFATGYTADVIQAAGVDATPRRFDDEPRLAELLATVRTIRRAPGRPHKLYLLLCAVARIEAGAPRAEPYERWHEYLEPLLTAEAPESFPHPEYPFVRLVGDELWELHSLVAEELSNDSSPAQLAEAGARGGLPETVHEMLLDDRAARRAFAYAALAHLDPEQRRIAVHLLGLGGLVTVDGLPPPTTADTAVPAPVPTRDAPPAPTGGSIAAGALVEMEAEAKALGREGELWVVDEQRERLRMAGRPELAEQVDHIAAREDGAGYDVLSFDPDTGEELFIEVKTTAGGPRTAYVFTDNELRISCEHADRYRLYRVFDFRTDPKHFVLSGPLDEPYFTRARTYSAHPSWYPRHPE